MSKTADAIFALDARLDVALDDLSSGFVDSLQATLRALRLRVNALVRQLEREGGKIVATQVNLGLAMRALSQLEGALAEAGYHQVITAAYARLPELVQFTSISKAARAFSAFDVATLNAYRVVRSLELVTLFGSEFTQQASQIILMGVLGARTEAALVDDLQTLMDETAAHAQTLYETGMSEFVQTVEALHSEGTPDEAFIYSGPVDARIRPFCLERVGQVFTRKEIDSMDNGSLGNVFISRGGYQCRHMWHNVNAVDELKALAGTGEIASERVTQDIALVKQAQKDRKRPARKAA